ncbi:MAG: pyridoxamine 5'-phosphate oxidase family protein [Chloroflexota bacterium]|nr:pyridoxamine 5'-phosphate oxidase family protein [Chloroflexota bacterium]
MSAGPKATRPYMPGYGILPAGEGDGLLPWSWAVERLAAARNYWAVTVRPDGRPHAMAVWGVWLDDRFYFTSGERSRKARNIATNAACSVAIECASDEIVVVDGTAAEERDAEVIQRFIAVYEPKYQWKMDPIPGAVYVVRPQAVFGIGATPFEGTATRWVFE